MELNVSSPVWSVIILIAFGLAFTGYCVSYILVLAYNEMQRSAIDQNDKNGGKKNDLP